MCASRSKIAKQISGRTDDACAKRYREALDPAIKQGEWTDAEDQRLLEEYRRWGGRWASVAAQLGRSGLGCRNRWRLLERKKANMSSSSPKASGSGASSSHSLNDRTAPVPPSESAPATASVTSEQPESLSWPNDLIDQFRNELSGSNSLLFANSMDQLGTTIPLDAHLFDYNPFTDQPPAEFDARLCDIMQGGCGCGCGTGRGCGCSDDVSPPFMDIASQSFLQPFHQMSHAFSQVDPPPSYTVSQPSMPLSGDVPMPFSEQLSPPSFVSTPVDITSAFTPTPTQSVLMPGASSSTTLNVHSVNTQPNPVPIEPLQYPSSSDVQAFASPSEGHPPAIHKPLPADLSLSLSTHSSLFGALGPATPSSTSAQPDAGKPETDTAKRGSCCKPDPPTSTSSTVVVATIPRAAAPSCKCTGTCCGPTKAGTSTPVEKRASGCCQPPAIVIGVKRSSGSVELGTNSKKAKSGSKEPASRPRLSSNLAATSNTQVTPYACGDPKCWISDDDIRARFNTSGELLEHYRTVHDDSTDGTNSKVFRCALEGCGKGWKVGIFPVMFPLFADWTLCTEYQWNTIPLATLQVSFLCCNQPACVTVNNGAFDCGQERVITRSFSSITFAGYSRGDER